MPVLAQLAAHLVSGILRRLFLQLPDLDLDDGMMQAFDDLLCRAGEGEGEGLLRYDYAYPKSEFLRYIVAHKNVLLHGSNNPRIDLVRPKEQTDFSGKHRTAVFATGDGIWPIFFAVLDQANYSGSLRNGCFVVVGPRATEKRFYFFSLNADMWVKHPWTDGVVYILPREPFRRTSTGTVRFDEWACEEPVRPLARLPVSPGDFPFLPNVTAHSHREPVYISWLCFKRRQHQAGWQGRRKAPRS